MPDRLAVRRCLPLLALVPLLWLSRPAAAQEPGRTGFAHLFEHMMFQGSANVKKGEHMALLMSQGGRANATTPICSPWVTLPPRPVRFRTIWKSATP